MIEKLKKMDKVCLLIPEFCEFDGISQLVKRAVHSLIICGIQPTILCDKWNGYIPEGWVLGEVKREDDMYEIKIMDIDKKELYRWGNKKECIKFVCNLKIK